MSIATLKKEIKSQVLIFSQNRFFNDGSKKAY